MWAKHFDSAKLEKSLEPPLEDDFVKVAFPELSVLLGDADPFKAVSGVAAKPCLIVCAYPCQQLLKASGSGVFIRCPIKVACDPLALMPQAYIGADFAYMV